MEHKMTLLENQELFTQLLIFAANSLRIRPEFIEKDYWITRALQRMSRNANADKVVFKGGTSLSKAYRLTKRFSEDIDIAVIDADSFSGNQLKIFIKRLAKNMSADLDELIVPNVTSKGSRFYKAIYQYPNLVGLTSSVVKTGQILIEVNTYANPYPYTKQEICSFLTEYLMTSNKNDLIEEYDLNPFAINVLDKRRTIVEKLVSLFRFSFATDTVKSLSSKIRHFYDIYYLVNDDECSDYIQSADFRNDFQELFIHDQQQFSEPEGWCTKTIKDSPLLKDFSGIWSKLSSNYQRELTPLVFSEIPNEMLIAQNFTKILKAISI
jgi:hypothetical protein